MLEAPVGARCFTSTSRTWSGTSWWLCPPASGERDPGSSPGRGENHAKTKPRTNPRQRDGFT